MSETFWKIVDSLAILCVGICVGNMIALRAHVHDKSLFSNVNTEIEYLYEQHDFDHSLIMTYSDYYNKAEALFDTLETQYNWMDRLDPQEYYDARAKVFLIESEGYE